METKNEEVTPKKKKRNPFFIILLILLLVGGSWFGISKYRYSLHHEETDDAQVSADILLVIPHVSGYIKEVRVKDNQWVKKGDTLIILDDRDYKLKLEEAEAALGIAKANLQNAIAMASASKANIATSAASIVTIDSQIAAAKITAWRANQDYERYANLIKDHSITQQQYEQAWAAKETAEKQLSVLQGQKNQASHQTNAVTVQSNATAEQVNVAQAAIRQREVDVDAAKLSLSYTIITADEDGHLSKVGVQPGQFVQAGQALFSMIHSQDVWVVANFKETQLNKMREGQSVIVTADAYPRHEFKAVVSSFSPATGSTFALLPPDNASGNFVKVVQRLPVKIEFTDASDSLIKKLRPGLNVTVDVSLE
ncbi:MAG: HlyD family secretion protein [Chitinophagales bacterium]|nr:HlyD family secretion protein [Chitinophagales bacterium]